jgi:hypothetical protein
MEGPIALVIGLGLMAYLVGLFAPLRRGDWDTGTSQAER